MNSYCASSSTTHNDPQMNDWKMNEDDLERMMRFYMEGLGGMDEGSHRLMRRFECNGVHRFGFRIGYETNRGIIQMILGSFE